MPLDRPLEPRVVVRIADLLLPDPERDEPVFLNETVARRNLEAAGVPASRLEKLKGDAIIRVGLDVANEDPSIIGRYLENVANRLNGLGDPSGHEYLVGQICEALQADGYDISYAGNVASIVPYVEPPPANRDAATTSDSEAEIDRIIRWFERLHNAERVLTDERRAPDSNHPHAKYPIENEYDLQDLFLAFLVLEYPRAHKEDPTPSSAGASGRVDIVVPELALYIELKYHRKDGNWAATRKSIAEKMLFYPDGLHCTTLLVAVYDRNRSLSKASIEADLVKTLKTSYGDVSIRAVVG